MNVTKEQIRVNLRRTANKGLISFLDRQEFNGLLEKYYGIKKDGKCVGYMDPYTGEELLHSNKIVVEHIIPVSSGGGTILFNCTVTSVDSNRKKGAKHLMGWWPSSGYYSSDRLCHLLDYMFEAYHQVFAHKDVYEVLNSYLVYKEDFEVEDYSFDLKDEDLSITQEESLIELKRQQIQTGFIHYYEFLNDCIVELEKDNIDTRKYYDQLDKLRQYGIFEKIEKFELCQKVLKKIIRSKLEEDGRRELTILLNYDVLSLTNSMEEYQTYNEIGRELNARMDNLERILEDNNIGIISYLEDIQNCPNILIKKVEEITEEDIVTLLDSIQLGTKYKFDRLIELYQNNRLENPSQCAYDELERKIGIFFQAISTVRKNANRMHVTLSKRELKYLCESDDERLRKIYETILYKALKYGVSINYVDEFVKKRLQIVIDIRNDLEKIEDCKEYINTQLKLLEENEELLERKDQKFCKLIKWYQNNLEVKIPPTEKMLCEFFHRIRTVDMRDCSFRNILSKNQLKYLCKSDDERLREIYETILYKALKYGVSINYVDEFVKKRLQIVIDIRNDLEKIEDCKEYINTQLKLLEENEEFLERKDQKFCKLIKWYQIHDDGNPSSASRNEFEKEVGCFFSMIRSVRKRESSFYIVLSRKQLEFLCNSNDKRLRKIYEIILYKSLENDLSISYVNESVRDWLKIVIDVRNHLNEVKDYREYIKLQLSLLEENEGFLEEKDRNFCKLVKWYQNNEIGNPSLVSKNELEKMLGRMLNRMTSINKYKTSLMVNLSKMQLEYLYYADDERLRNIYFKILKKVNENGIDIAWYPNEPLNRGGR